MLCDVSVLVLSMTRTLLFGELLVTPAAQDRKRREQPPCIKHHNTLGSWVQVGYGRGLGHCFQGMSHNLCEKARKTRNDWSRRV